MKKYLILLAALLLLGCQDNSFTEHIINRRDNKIISEYIERENIQIIINYYNDGSIANFQVSDRNYSIAGVLSLDGKPKVSITDKLEPSKIEQFPSEN
ncbi:hypothetical protein EW093_06475 [Thiospirochaeta perfilievii]|uniref:DUF1433 domain-containing protein n=1 Tax=Thiospirochaeta perfilievii TaxID=252967 RepID=A0A5C1QBW1_9SPIO|nr:hypothetical protein [Thiospirochaeta perfilievii]QEN04359.1 hypothetical protein EW093_06475 [Thiospirochaeta perfilievii]